MSENGGIYPSCGRSNREHDDKPIEWEYPIYFRTAHVANYSRFFSTGSIGVAGSLPLFFCSIMPPCVFPAKKSCASQAFAFPGTTHQTMLVATPVQLGQHNTDPIFHLTHNPTKKKRSTHFPIFPGSILLSVASLLISAEVPISGAFLGPLSLAASFDPRDHRTIRGAIHLTVPVAPHCLLIHSGKSSAYLIIFKVVLI